ncbi:MAG: glutathione S-transferase family protein [Burkholderiaceae bacterium]
MNADTARDDDSPILHHYGFSPFAEKIRLALGIKGLRWHSVIAPSVLPKPELVALTGGYRHIPVLQYGADVYCDTRTIIRELDRRHPEPAIDDPVRRVLATPVEAWAERDLFWPIARFVSGINAEKVDPQLHVDRASLRGKPAPSIARLKAVAQRELSRMRPLLPIIEGMLAGDSTWLLDDRPGKADLAVYHGLWFLSAMPIDCSGELAPYPAIRRWMDQVAAIGHGRPVDMAAARSLEIARTATPGTPADSVDDDSLPALGSHVAIRPDDYSTAAVEGMLVRVTPDDVALRRDDAALREVVVHFPRIGYALKEIA